MTEAEQIMKRCQAGTRNYEEANNLHAACYGMIGKLLAQQEKDYERGFIGGMQKQMQSSVDKAVNRMAQPEQEPWCMKMNGCKTKCEDCPDEPPQTEQEPVAVYGYCPECGAKGVMRERRPNGNDKCANGHTYPSSKSTPPQLEQEPVADDFFRMIADKNPKPFPLPQRTWVGLFDDEIMQIWGGIIKYAPSEVRIKYFARAIESKLKEVNT